MFVIFALLACQPEPTPESTPLLRPDQGGGKVQMNVGPDGLKPIPVSRLQAIVPALSDRPTSVQQTVVAAINLVPGPCDSCDGAPLAHCLVNASAECSVALALVQRAMVLADSGKTGDEVKVAVNYPDLWFPDLGSGVPVTVTLWQDQSGPFGEMTETVRRDISARFGSKVNWSVYDTDIVAPAHLDVRARPTWFVNGHRFRGMQSAETIGRFIGFELIEAQ